MCCRRYRISCPLADGSFGMLLSLTPGVNKHNVAWHVCDSIKVPSGGIRYIVGSCSTRSTGPMRVLGYRATAEPFADEPTSLQA